MNEGTWIPAQGRNDMDVNPPVSPFTKGGVWARAPRPYVAVIRFSVALLVSSFGKRYRDSATYPA